MFFYRGFMKKDIIPVLLGADLNCYSVARAFYEAYDVPSYAFGKYAVGETQHSKIVKFTAVPNLTQNDVLCRTLTEFAAEHAGSELYLLACTDEYEELVIKNRDVLGKYYFCPCPTAEIAEKLITKESFYKMCEEHALPHPQTLVFRKNDNPARLENLGFDYPIIVKPSSSIEYWRAPFDGMKKVYTAESPEEAKKIISAIYGAGYAENIILQEFIPGGEQDMYVLTTYSSQNAKVCAACMGHVLLGEHTPKGLGNHVAIITEEHKETEEKLTSFLENIGYTGFANFDIIKDTRDGSFKILEINLRQGRSNYYVTSSGINIAKLVVGDKRNELPPDKLPHPAEHFWHTVPKKIIYNYIKDENLKSRAKALVAGGKASTSLFYAKDFCNRPLRAAYLFIHNIRYYKKFKQS